MNILNNLNRAIVADIEEQVARVAKYGKIHHKIVYQKRVERERERECPTKDYSRVVM